MEKNISEIEEFIISNKIGQALIELKKIFQNFNDEDLVNESLLILSRLKIFSAKSNQGVIDYFDLEYSKIRLSTLSLKSAAKKLLEKTDEGVIRPKINYPNLNIVFRDDFNSNDSGWFEGEDEICKSYIKNGRYFIEHLRNKLSLLSWEQEIEIDTTKNFQLKCGIMFIEGTKTNGYGISWGGAIGDENSEFYLFDFVVSANGAFRISYYIENKTINIVEWTKNSAIKLGVNTNNLEVLKNGELMHYKINNEVVFTSEFNSFFGNKTGVI